MKSDSLSNRDFNLIGSFIQETWGIKMPANKRVMLESRLMKRLRKLNLGSFEEYRDYLFSPAGAEKELLHLIDAVSTNKTDFFREPRAFQYLTEVILPRLSNPTDDRRRGPIRAWSAGCSTGEEPYTLAMVLGEYAEANPDINFEYVILATDISTSVLEQAKLAVYDRGRIDPIPVEVQRKYLLRSKNPSLKQSRIAPEVRAKVKFRRLNLMDDFKMRESMDVIFCRNVIIYFDRPTQEELLLRLCGQLAPGGYLIMGHSETLSGLDLPLISAAPMVYRKR